MDTKNAEARNQNKQEDAKKDWLKGFGIDTAAVDVLGNLEEVQKAETEASLSRNNRTVRDNSEKTKTRAGNWITARIKQITADIDDLQKQLTSAQASSTSSAPPLLPVVNAEGIVVTGDELAANPSKSAYIRSFPPYFFFFFFTSSAMKKISIF
jgi:hypothetical protein